MRERREELKKFREEKKRKAKDEPKTTTPAKKAEVEPVAKRAKTENTDEKPAASHDEPAASGDGDETFLYSIYFYIFKCYILFKYCNTSSKVKSFLLK